MRIIQIMPAEDWYFKHETTVWNVAAFGLTDEGETIGLIGAGSDGTLKTVPTRTGGVYLHRRQLTEDESQAADKKR
ncbi:methionyl-tRNA formyltransferase [Pseudoduganella violacea]|uniref:Uncharacterized protein n=1 Tax=Pseudoduganella violacea TaxID=1715466 RepID=A0A7W5FWX0_9BURK|nr:methionyl-tRNA formyltransferase [Pseudoduganella violacea]MBB3122480.1 hypothetical protein [Pseudoduganella violacea]